MKLFALFLICLSALCESGLGLSVHGGASLSYPYIRVVPEEVMARRNTGTGAEAASTTLSRRSPRLDRSTIITIIVGAIGGVAMVATLSLAILLLIRKQRQKARGLAQSSTKAHFPTGSNPAPPDALSPKTKERPYYGFQHFPSAPPSPPQAAPRVDNMESVWFGTDKSGEKAQSRRAMSPPGRQTYLRGNLSDTRPCHDIAAGS
ncbi:hypothetical protein C8R44DRAFT_162577 [Mycena epipterygia]|nr:hypothetical protein C8R44DRAFT_162577 [Mycena epipterygia]